MCVTYMTFIKSVTIILIFFVFPLKILRHLERCYKLLLLLLFLVVVVVVAAVVEKL